MQNMHCKLATIGENMNETTRNRNEDGSNVHRGALHYICLMRPPFPTSHSWKWLQSDAIIPTEAIQRHSGFVTLDGVFEIEQAGRHPSKRDRLLASARLNVNRARVRLRDVRCNHFTVRAMWGERGEDAFHCIKIFSCKTLRSPGERRFSIDRQRCQSPSQLEISLLVPRSKVFQ